MKVMVTGSEGYLGTLLVEQLVSRGYDVVGFDTAFYRGDPLYQSEVTPASTLRKDVREIETRDFEGIDAVVHMAELSNDPLGQVNTEVTHKINHQGSVHLAKTMRKAGVSRLVYMSSCSVYGVAKQDVVDETSEVNPQTAYAVCKTLVEKDLQAMAGDDFSPTFFRNATAFGASPRMRFDIVLNNLAGLAWTTKEIKMISDGTPWRPLVHGLDISQAIIETLEAPREAVHNEIFNVGSTDQNYQIRQIAETVAEAFPGCQLSFGPKDPDNRSYRVSFDKIHKHLPNFKCQWDIQRGARQLHDVFEKIQMTQEVFQHRCFTRLKSLEHLLQTGQINDDFYWIQKAA